MIRFLFRFLAAVSLAVAVLFAVADATRSVAASALSVTPLGENWIEWSPAGFTASRDWVVGMLGEAGWDLVETVIRLPGAAVFALLALFFYAIGYRRAPRRGHLGLRA